MARNVGRLNDYEFEYESVFVVTETCNVRDKLIDGILEFINHAGKLLNYDPHGLKKMAYPIKGETQGYFYTIRFRCEKECIPLYEKNMRNNNFILKFMTIRVEDY